MMIPFRKEFPLGEPEDAETEADAEAESSVEISIED